MKTELRDLLLMQRHLDEYIIAKNCPGISPSERLNNTLLAMVVEIGEMANELRCFKHWSTKKPSAKDMILEEFVDVLHFFLSVANQLSFSADDISEMYAKKNEINFARQNSGY